MPIGELILDGLLLCSVLAHSTSEIMRNENKRERQRRLYQRLIIEGRIDPPAPLTKKQAERMRVLAEQRLKEATQKKNEELPF